MNDEVRLAVGTLTALPVPPPSTVAAPVPGRAMTLAPAVGLIPGLAGWVVAAAALRLGLAPLVAAVLGVGVLALLTRGLHLDGLADTADAFAASYQRERALEVMRRGDTGPAGTAAVALVLLLQVAALAQVLGAVETDADGLFYGSAPAGALGAAVAIAAVAGRCGVPVACARPVPAARPEGLGALVAGSVAPVPLVLALVASAAGCGALAWFAGLPWWGGVLAVVLAVAGSMLVLRRAVRRLGGITGDVIGACVEAGTALALTALAIAS